MAPELKSIDPKLPRWEPAADPNDIVVPGLDTTAPPYDQIEQIEQLITIKLQNIDANFSKIQHVMANRILPAVKRYAVGTQPVREAARFWTTFYEQAAQIRIPTYDDYDASHEQEDGTEITHTESEATPAESSSRHSDSESEGVRTPQAHHTFNPDQSSSEVSFAPAQGAVSSTPAISRKRSSNPNDSFSSQASEHMPSWSSSLESPLLQLNREIQSLAVDHSLVPSTSLVQDADEASEDITQRNIRPNVLANEPSTLRPTDKGKAREGHTPLLQNVLRRNANTSTATASTSRTTSPLKFKPKTPVLKSLNPYLPPDSNPSDWRGVVDLKDPSIASPQRPVPRSTIKLATFKPSTAISIARTRTKTPPPGDDSFDENFGMSPPVMTDYARLPTLGRTPKKEAAERIMQSLVDVEKRGVFGPVGAAHRGTGGGKGKALGTGYGAESSMSSMPTPPSMTRYSRPSYVPGVPSDTSRSGVDASLDSLMRRVGLNVSSYNTSKQFAPAPDPSPAPEPSRPPVFSSLSSTSSMGSLRSAGSSARVFQPPPPPLPKSEPVQVSQVPQYDFYNDEVVGRADADADDSMDSLDYDDPNDADAPPFVFESQNDSFDDSFDSSLGDDDGTGEGGVPFIITADDGDAFDDDDSFDDPAYAEGEEETVFGVPPAQRLRQQAQGSGLRMLGEDLLQDTIGIGAQMAVAGRVEESPTPWNNNGRG
ncbi:hypothetical protein L226DRAFT_568682 [Lentinus tigrinus ALCF2SS1-7]|uniref:DASH complex subunit ASK1 n=1 Tax=Lentinus tigrinus ALCF2SS1-6 TaxID=1328759 RepID=A0A5C2SM76_9APHY|nr:hypothetical protein L227DRAFT_498298 [Lentinus tigrinus ALCF2SS1-6]RPD77655.1 hypothetical protein L226DRAFT_568682 [Lentinus tigrinus ALCF2SS1-7]